MLFSAQISEVDGVVVARIVGEVDLSTLPPLQTALEQLDGPDLAVDLRSVDWFDPVCLGVLLAADLRAGRRGATLRVVADGAVAELLSEVGLVGVLEIVSELPVS